MSDLRLRQATSSATPLQDIWAQMFAQLQAQASESSVSGAGSGVLSSSNVEEATAAAASTGGVRIVPLWQTTVETVFRTTTASVTVPAEPVTVLPTSSETAISISTKSSASTTSQDISTPTVSASSTASSSISFSTTSSPTRSRTLFPLEPSSTASSTTSFTPIPPGVLSFDPPSSSPTSSSSDTSLMKAPMPTMPADHASSSGSGGLSASSKRAIVGSLAGAIGGLILIGLLMCIFLRRRHKRQEEEEAPKDELKEPKPPRYHMVRKWSDFTLQTERSTPEIVQGSQPSAPDGSVIRVSTDHWKRPFAKDEGPRDSQGPGALRIVNPDNSRSSSPKFPSDIKNPRKQHPALRAYNHVRSRTTSRSAVPQLESAPIVAQPQAAHIENIQKPRAAVISQKPAQLHSSKSSSSTQAIVRPQPLEDPFGPTTANKKRQSPPSSKRYSPPSSGSRPRRPSLQRITTSMSHLRNKSINPFNNKVIPSSSIPPFQGYVAPELSFWDPQRQSQGSTYSVSPPQYTAPPVVKEREEVRASGHVVKKSDPFDLLISPSTRDNAESSLAARAKEDERHTKAKTEGSSQNSSPPNWVAYEGT